MASRIVPLEVVFIVEDEAVIAMQLEDALKAHGARQIHCFPSATQAVAALAMHNPGLLIMDLELTDSADGHDIAEVALQVCAPPPRLIFSTATPEKLPKRLAEAGHVFAKPYDADELAKFAANL